MNSYATALIPRRGSRTVRVARSLTALLWLNACHTWQPLTLHPTTGVGADTRVRVEYNDGGSVILVGPSVVADSLVGPRAGSWDRAAIAVSDIRHADARRTSVTRTILAVLGATALVAVTVTLLLGAEAAAALSTSPAY